MNQRFLSVRQSVVNGLFFGSDACPFFYQFQFPAPCHRFDLKLSAQSVSLCSGVFAVKQFYRTAGCGVSRSGTLVVGGNAPLQIVGDPRIECSVAAADDIAVIRG